MPRFSVFLVAVAALLMFVACDEVEPEEEAPPDLEGFYEVVLQTTEDPCGAEPADVETPVTYFKLEKTQLFFTRVLGFFNCSDGGGDPNVCDDALRLELSGIGRDNEVELSVAGGSEQSCTVTATSGQWTKTADGVRLETTTSSAEFENVDECSTELAEDRADELSCAVRLVVEGRAL